MMILVLISQALLQQQALNPNISFILDMGMGMFWSDSLGEVRAMSPGLEGEMVLQEAVDPFLDLQVVVGFHGPEDGEDHGGAALEEAYATTRSRILGIQFRLGKFLSSAGRLNDRHPHQWDFSTPPRSFAAFFGEEGLSGVGLRANLLLPLPVYALLEGELLGRDTLTATFNLSVDAGGWTHLLGLSRMMDRHRPADGFWDLEWTAKRYLSSYRYLAVQGEAMADSGRWGGYIQIVVAWNRRFRSGIRVDGLEKVQQQIGAGGMVEWNPSEFSRFRLQLDREDRTWSVGLFFQAAVGPHGAHTF